MKKISKILTHAAIILCAICSCVLFTQKTERSHENYQYYKTSWYSEQAKALYVNDLCLCLISWGAVLVETAAIGCDIFSNKEQK